MAPHKLLVPSEPFSGTKNESSLQNSPDMAVQSSNQNPHSHMVGQFISVVDERNRRGRPPKPNNEESPHAREMSDV